MPGSNTAASAGSPDEQAVQPARKRGKLSPRDPEPFLPTDEPMGVGGSTCKGIVNPCQDEDDMPARSVSTVTRLPFLPQFEDREPYKPSVELVESDSSLLKALTHHRTPFAVVDGQDSDLPVRYASGGFVAGMGMPVESIEGTGLASVLKKGIKAKQADIDRVTSAVQSHEVT